MPSVAVTTWHLEITDPRDLRPKRSERTDLALVPVQPAFPELNRFLYASVGADWYWIDRLPWTYQRWADYLQRPELYTWLLTVRGIPAGYFELEAQPDQNVEIAYFGLLPSFVGLGLGGHLLTHAIETGWTLGAKRVWLHTCSLDHPLALANYQARGLRLFHQETETKMIPDNPIGPWPGSR